MRVGAKFKTYLRTEFIIILYVESIGFGGSDWIWRLKREGTIVALKAST